ncbi:Serine/threonine-protein kinase GRIK2 [Linum perenne]
MFRKTYYFARAIGCCSCFGLIKRTKRKSMHIPVRHHNLSQELLLDEDVDGDDNWSYNGEITDSVYGEDQMMPCSANRSEEIMKVKQENGMVCRQFPVKETHILIRSEDEYGNKTINEYVRECKIGAGSYGKVVLYRSSIDGKHYAIKAFHKSYLLKLRVGPSETAMTDVLREVLIMKMLQHPNIVNLVEVIDDPNTDHFYMVLEYVDGKWFWEGCGPPGGIGEHTARKYLRNIVSGLMYLHAHNIVHGDIKPDNLLVTSNGVVKIGDFSVSQVFEDENDELRRSPGTPVFTAPECCLGQSIPFLEKHCRTHMTRQIVNNPLVLPDRLDSKLKDLLEGLLSKDPTQRLTLDAVADHAWVVGEDGPVPKYPCWCRRSRLTHEQSDGNKIDEEEESAQKGANKSQMSITD